MTTIFADRSISGIKFSLVEISTPDLIYIYVTLTDGHSRLIPLHTA